jgi:tripartite-type tricarboxylate transporter receptor subunit TctC
MTKTRIAAAAAAAAAILSWVPAAHSQLQPNRPIRIVTTGFGGGTDFAARQVASGLNAGTGQTVIVENRGSSVVPGEVVSKASPDGHTLLVTTGGIQWVLPLFQKVPYDPVKDFAPVSLTGSFPTVLVISASVPAGTVKEFIALAKAKPGAYNHVMTAHGGSAHLSAALLAHMAGINIVPVPYKNTGTAITDLVSGRVHLFFSASGPVMPHVKTGRLKALAVTSAKPFPLLPDLPTMASAVPGYEMEAVYCLFAPAGTPPATIRQLNGEVRKLLAQPDVKEKFLAAGIEPRGSSPAELAKLMKSDSARMARLVKDAGLKAQ